MKKRLSLNDENVFLKAVKALSKLNFLFQLKSKKNWVTLRKCNSHLQYYKIDLSFSIELQEINLNAIFFIYFSYSNLNFISG